MPQNPTAANARDLTDAEFADLDELLQQTPEPLTPCDAVMLDGYLCGILVQPVLLQPDAWLPHIFDFEGEPLPDDVDVAWLERTTALIMRRHAALNRAMEEDGWFDPLVLEFDEEHQPEPIPEGQPDPMAGLHPISQSLMPWVAGFQHATICFPDLVELPDDAVMAALARLFRHLPAETDEEKEVVATLDREQPLTTLEDAIEEIVLAVADLQDLTREQRYKVETVKRDAPKVGRNDPCPCGSGKKFKHCHGA
ncbi:UPF0149 family protein [Piscinibacter terrae]|uniref:YecA family protein n=1 Tax=Piscinibacter terrae TaxID=2496871 RepID=A0A3N7HT31_9BURK|nr:UPF0149 family protein [Albitalea terrae]RQP24001.1 YecA family protein [Albitalea terrae]